MSAPRPDPVPEPRTPGQRSRPVPADPPPMSITEKLACEWEARHDVAARRGIADVAPVQHYLSHARLEQSTHAPTGTGERRARDGHPAPAAPGISPVVRSWVRWGEDRGPDLRVTRRGRVLLRSRTAPAAGSPACCEPRRMIVPRRRAGPAGGGRGSAGTAPATRLPPPSGRGRRRGRSGSRWRRRRGRARWPPDVERVRIGKDLRVAVGRRQHQQDQLAGGDRHTVTVVSRVARRPVRCTGGVDPETSSTAFGHSDGSSASSRRCPGWANSRRGAVADQVDRGLEPRAEDQRAGGQHLPVGEPLAVLVGRGDERGEQVVAG